MGEITRRVLNFGGGLCSWGAGRRLVDRYGPESVTLLFADTNMECADMARFLGDCSKDLGVPLTVIGDKKGRTPWDVFFDVRFLGNSRVDPCSRILKRELLDKWHADNCDPSSTVIYVGLAWDEMHRVERFVRRIAPWKVEAPLCEPPYLSKNDIAALAFKRGIAPPKLHTEGFPHNNCGGFCIKAGQAQFALLLKTRPETFAFHEKKEKEFREFIGKDVSVLRDRRGGRSRPLTMESFRKRIEAGKAFDEYEWGGCGCAIS